MQRKTWSGALNGNDAVKGSTGFEQAGIGEAGGRFFEGDEREKGGACLRVDQAVQETRLGTGEFRMASVL